nr:ComEC/Rec2 family competence protein [uncultured Ligilactobacillus sp.]
MLLILFLRIYFTNYKPMIITLFIGGILWSVFQLEFREKFYNHIEDRVYQNAVVQVYSDEIKYTEDSAKFVAKDLHNNEQIQIVYMPSKINDLDYLKKFHGKLLLQVNGKIRTPDLPTNENQFNYRNFLLSKNIYYIAFVNKINCKSKTANSLIEKIIINIHIIREKLINYFNTFPKILGSYASALILGILTDDFYETSNNIRTLGLLYLFCLSGMHVFFIRRYITDILQLFRISKEVIDLILLLVFPCYCIIGGENLSLVRAVLMICLGIISSFVLKVPLSGIECWSIALIIHLAFFPALLYSLGAQLSYLMTFILLSSEEESSIFLNFKLNNYSMPLILNSTFQWNILTSILSIVVGYLFEKIIFPLTIIGISMPIFKSGVSFVLNIFDHWFKCLASLPFLITFGKMPIVIVIFILFIQFRCENRKNLMIKYFLIVMVYFITFCFIHFPLTNEIVYFDIGQGDSTLIREKFNRNIILIDTGGKVTFNDNKEKQNTIGESVIANYLLSKGINRIDGLYLTHQDTDHVGYFPSIGKKIYFSKIFVPAGMERLKSFRSRLAKIKEQKVKVIPTTFLSSNENNIKILHPFNSGKGRNQDSLVLYKKIESFRFIFTGDLDQNGELKVINSYPNLKVDILKTGHHGSKTSTNDDFVQKIQPKLAVISAGRHNRYGHPNQETLDVLNRHNIPYLITAKNGMIKVEIKNNHIKIKKALK